MPRLRAGRRASRSPPVAAALDSLAPSRPAATALAPRRPPRPSVSTGRRGPRSPLPIVTLDAWAPSQPPRLSLPAGRRGPRRPRSPQATLLLVRRRAAWDAGAAARGARWRVTGWKGHACFFLSV
ncbi:hypothetical protein PVAP13_2NG393003 [Panicum virgatum]|uniref:Uncharacterized protein n=1 Tax=Panicum virgatum TaxID=38727 RepID=A0A8T0VSX2_PANVG|nr:hypothetical protein PVAP13_2NG393003 [Panicum virgatum]